MDQLTSSTTTWRAIGQQVVFGNATLNGAILNYDQWDGYQEQRDRLVKEFVANDVQNLVVLTGDIHFGAVGTIRDGDPADGTPVGAEFVATSISSAGNVPADVVDVVKGLPSVLDAELAHQGWILHTVTRDAWTAEFRMVENVKLPESPVFVHNTYVVDAGTNTARIA
jgi:alkaline phosphatase D